MIDKVLSVIGFGKFQKLLLFSLISCSFLCCIVSLSFSYLTKQPAFLCRDNANQALAKCNFEEEKFCNKEKFPEFEYQKDRSNSLYNWAFSFDLYCSNKQYLVIIGSGFFIGAIFGCVVITPLPDKYGRKNVIKICLSISCIIHFLILTSFNRLLLSILCIISGFISSIYGNFSLYVAEYIPKENSAISMSFIDAVYPFMGFVEAIYFLVINNWRILFLFTTILHIFATYFILKYLPESPKWLYDKGKIDESLEMIKTIAEINGKEKEVEAYINLNYKEFNDRNNRDNTQVNDKKSNDSQYNIISIIIKYPSQRLVIFILSFTFFCAAFCFYGIILSLENMKGNFFQNSIFSFFGEMVAELSSGYLASIYGRTIILKLGGFVGALGFLGNILCPYNLKPFLLLVSMMGYSSTFNVLYIYSPEIIPSSIRSTVCGALYFCGMTAPSFVPFIKTFFPNRFDTFFVVFGFLYSIACINLKETLGKEVNDDIEEEKKEIPLVGK